MLYYICDWLLGMTSPERMREMKIGNLVQWTDNRPGFPKRQGIITRTFRCAVGPKAGMVTSHRVQWFTKDGDLRVNTFRPRDLIVLA